MKIGICEDNIIEQEQYKAFFKKLGYNNIVVFSSGEELLQEMPDLDLLFLDIEMDKISGIQIKNIFEEKRKNTYIVFYTTHIEAMPDAFGANVLGFLRKPVTYNELKIYTDKTCLRLIEDCPVLLDDGKYISSSTILYIQSDHNYTILYTGKSHNIVRKPLKLWIPELAPYGFAKTCRSYIANLYNANYIEKSSLVMVNGDKIPVSRNLFNKVKEAYNGFQLRLYNKSINR